jgi:O-antigen ligase
VIVPLPIGRSIGASDLILPFALWALLRQRLHPAHQARFWFLLFVVASALSTTLFLLQGSYPVGGTSLDALLIVRMYSIYLPLLLVLGWNDIEIRDISRISATFMWSATLSCSIGLVLFLLGVQVRDAQQTNWYGNGIAATLRAGGLTGNSADFGLLAAALGTAAITFGIVYLRRTLLSILIFAFAIYMAYVSSSRAALLHLFIALALMLPVFARGRLAPLLVLSVPVLVVVLGIALPLMPLSPTLEFALHRFDIFNLTGESTFFSSSSRLDTWNALFSLIAKHPLIGIGYGMTVPVTGGAGDNSFLTLFVETGLFAGALFLTFWISVVVIALRSPSGPRKFVAIAVVLSEISHMMTVDTQKMWDTAPCSLLLVGLAIVGAYTNQPATDPRRAPQRLGARNWPGSKFVRSSSRSFRVAP